MAEKENRCWPGYQPVPGKEPHSQGSCKPKPDSKSTPAQKEFKAKRRKQLDRWDAEHPGKRPASAQHLHAPDAEDSSSKKIKPSAKSGTTKGKANSSARKSPTTKKRSTDSTKRKTR